MNYDHYGFLDPNFGFFIMGFLLVAATVASLVFVALYVVTSFFLMRLLTNAGHKNPVAAWVPFWNVVAFLELGGVSKPWFWILAIFGTSFLASILSIPLLSFAIMVAVFVVSVVLTAYAARAAQAGVGKGGQGGAVLAVLLFPVWVIWMSIESSKRPFDQNAMVEARRQFPFGDWFGESDPYEPFLQPAGTWTPSSPAQAAQQAAFQQFQQWQAQQQSQTPTAPSAATGAGSADGAPENPEAAASNFSSDEAKPEGNPTTAN